MKVYIVISYSNQDSTKDMEIEFVSTSENDADEYASEMDECCIAGKYYEVQEWDV